MIANSRPLCVVVPIDFDRWEHRDLKRQLAETIDFEGDMFEGDMDDESHVPGRIVEACCAEWSKHEFDEDGNRVTQVCDITKIVLDVNHYVKCMEPAAYYLCIPGAMSGGVFCEFHKPRIRGI